MNCRACFDLLSMRNEGIKMYRSEFFTDRLIIREYTKRDIDSFLRVIRQPEIYPTTYGIPHNYSKLRAKWWFRVIKQNRRQGFAYEYGAFLRESGYYIGNVGLINIDRNHAHADISYYIDSGFTNKGYATEASLEMLRYGFEELGFHKINGVCMSVNGASRRVMEKSGMKYEGTLRQDLYKDGIYYDIDRLSILKDEYYTMRKVEN